MCRRHISTTCSFFSIAFEDLDTPPINFLRRIPGAYLKHQLFYALIPSKQKNNIMYTVFNYYYYFSEKYLLIPYVFFFLIQYPHPLTSNLEIIKSITRPTNEWDEIHVSKVNLNIALYMLYKRHVLSTQIQYVLIYSSQYLKQLKIL